MQTRGCFIVNGAFPLVRAGNSYLTGRLSTVDLLIKLACLVEESIVFTISKAADLN